MHYSSTCLVSSCLQLQLPGSNSGMEMRASIHQRLRRRTVSESVLTRLCWTVSWRWLFSKSVLSLMCLISLLLCVCGVALVLLSGFCCLLWSTYGFLSIRYFVAPFLVLNGFCYLFWPAHRSIASLQWLSLPALISSLLSIYALQSLFFSVAFAISFDEVIALYLCLSL